MASDKSVLPEVHPVMVQNLEMFREMEVMIRRMKESYIEDVSAASARRKSPLDVSHDGAFVNHVVDLAPLSDAAAGDLTDDAWTEAAVLAMRQTAVQGFVAPDRHLASVRALIRRATARDV